MKTEEEIREEVKKINKLIDKNASPLINLALTERKNCLIWVLEEENEVD